MAAAGWREAVLGHRTGELAGLAARDPAVVGSIVSEVPLFGGAAGCGD